MKTGSKWRKWDLHLHTPSSYDYNDKSVTNQQIIDSLVANNIEAAAITDHHLIDIDRIKDLQRLAKNRVTILPGIEFRAELGGSESIHFIGIFPEDCDIDHVWIKIQSDCDLTKKSISENGGDEKIHCDLKDTCSLIHKLGGLVTVHAGAKTNTIENITNTLPYKMALKTDLVLNHVDILELGVEKDQIDYEQKVFPVIKHTLPMVICSDNHDIKDYKFKQNCWIKSDPTFEGLKQILFEPTIRIKIAECPPIDPPIRLNKVTFDFPSESFLEDEMFCMAGKNEIIFNPNFTCLIGGRGTGKSTILNLIHEKLSPSEKSFFTEKKILDRAGKQIPIAGAVSIDGDTDEKYVEFLSQNEIEEFAQDYQKLTISVYNRIKKRDEDGIISKSEEELATKLETLNDHILNKIELAKIENELLQEKKELSANLKIVDSFSSPEYLKINSDIKLFSEKINSLKSSQNKYKSLVEDISKIISKHEQSKPDNLYNEQIITIIRSLKDLIENSKNTDFTKTNTEISTLERNLEIKRDELKSYLADKGLTEENQKDISNANINNSKIEQNISLKSQEIESLKKKISTFQFNDLEKASIEYELEIKKQVKSISSILEKLDSSSVKPISLIFGFDQNESYEEIFSDFKIAFENQISQSKHKGDNILKEVLFCIPPDKLSDHQAFLEILTKHKSSSAAKSFLIDLLSDKSNFEIYQLICRFNLLDKSKFKRIKVKYDGRPIEISSFGQRCTAVLVILLLLGNTPIIIDEPEAHLDSLLISNYLVEVIKDRKRNRQIIFATHNANFVINGDAELIHILTIDDSSKTTNITSTTIENPITRDELIGLEGGKEAFKKREHRYQIT